MNALRILGIRGVPAAHGGFETFAERLALHLVARGWQVTVYCQAAGRGAPHEDRWQGVHRVHIPVAAGGPLGTMVFDWRATRHAARAGQTCLTLGYNTALFTAWLRAVRLPHLMNMDGIEWRRAKWGLPAKAWLRLNEVAGCRLADHLVADHPAIADHLARQVPRSKISTIAYGADAVTSASEAPVLALGLEPGRYLTLIARPESENSVLEIVRGFSMRRRGVQLAVLGDYRDTKPYQRAVRQAAGPELRFLGPIYDAVVVHALRLHSLAYVHGHQVGGTNPSLVEALGAGNAVLMHDNAFNRWVAGDAGLVFADAAGLDRQLCELLASPALLHSLRRAARRRHAEAFTWPAVLQGYERLLECWQPSVAAMPPAR